MSLNVRSWRLRLPQAKRPRIIVIAGAALAVVGLIVWVVLPYGNSKAPTTTQSPTAQEVPAEGNYLLDGGTLTQPGEDHQAIKVSGASDGDLMARVTGPTVDVELKNHWQSMPGGSFAISGPDFEVIGRWNPMSNQIRPVFSTEVAQAGTVNGTVTIGQNQFPSVQVGATGKGDPSKIYNGHAEVNLVNFSVNSTSCQAVATVSTNSGTHLSLLSGKTMLSEVTAHDGAYVPLIANLQRSDAELSLGVVGSNGQVQVLSLIITLDPQQVANCPETRRAA
ncbi:hypothetical protein KSF_023880 [Reticulibacter mediterranei]|uniref:Uncharacterized protein n=1 Tax=Reticulibacter mediterranei TaxID=2778369 RepID=A0A8J3IKA3_9CHLR|nr:hypothetical protein KSF_023880 [Reticulibacter mediterranei]